MDTGASGQCSNKCWVSNKHWPLIDAGVSDARVLINAFLAFIIRFMVILIILIVITVIIVVVITFV